jgi:hypothetical protein
MGDHDSLMITAAQFDFERGYEVGFQEGLEKCRQIRLEKGREEALRFTISMILAQRFGPLDNATQAWIAGAIAPRLERALARLLTGPTVAAILADE